MYRQIDQIKQVFKFEANFASIDKRQILKLERKDLETLDKVKKKKKSPNRMNKNKREIEIEIKEEREIDRH